MSRYQQLADALAAEIRGGRIGVGQLLPTEAELCRQFDVSRHTVREALRVLRDQGLITSRQGVGSRVRASEPRHAYVEAVTSVDDLLEYAAATHLVHPVRKDVVADRALSAQLGTEPGRRWVHISGLRAANDDDSSPICWVDLYLDAAITGVQDLNPERQAAVSRQLEVALRDEVEVRQEIAAASVPREVALSLGVEPDADALRVVRTYVDRDGRVFLVSINLHPADRYTHRTVLVRRRAASGAEVRV